MSTAASQAKVSRPRRASRAPMRLSQDENSTSANPAPQQAQPRLIGKTSTTSLAGGRTVGKTAPSSSSTVAVGKAAVLPGPRRALGDVSNAGGNNRVQVDRTSKDSINGGLVKPHTRSRTASSNSSVSVNSTLPQPPSSTGTGLGRLKINSSSTAANPVPVKSSRPARTAVRSNSQPAPSVAPSAPRLQQGEWEGAWSGQGDVEVLRDDEEAAVGLGIDGTSEWAQDQQMKTEPAPSSPSAHSQAKSHKRTHDVEFSDEEDGGNSGAFNSHHDDKVRIVEPEQAIEIDPENWVADCIDEEDAINSELLLQQVKREFREEQDFWDISMVAEYSDEIFAYMSKLEEASMPNPRYMDHQSEIEWPMRTTLIDWLLQVHMRYHMLPETLWIAVNVIDRFLSNRVVSLVKFQLVGVTAMFIAAKYEEIMAPSVEEFVYMTEGGYSREEILKGERIMLQSLEFNISSYCSPYSWVRRISKADDYDIQTRTLSKFLMEVTLLDHRFLRAKPSMVAAIGMYLARRMLGGDWNEAFIFYSDYTEAQLLVPAGFLLESIAAPGFDEKFVYKKYSNKKFLKASIFARNWALKRAASEESS
ncbi:uncharacterized protein JCM6883_000187 [Sporobolomyces salmoneus]|uniref:uncharacterized protein n=1 Tax=Sporobolomyces salmoneus TaxID=183962 RepID=UPI0031813276